MRHRALLSVKKKMQKKSKKDKSIFGGCRIRTRDSPLGMPCSTPTEAQEQNEDKGDHEHPHRRAGFEPMAPGIGGARAVLHDADTQIAGPNPVLGRSRTQGDDPTSRVVVRQLQRRYIYPTPTRANGHQKDDPQPPRNITFQKRETTCFRNITFVKHDVLKT